MRLHRALNQSRWHHVRRLALERAQYRCECCGRPGRLEVDHIRPLSRGGDPYAMDNLQVLRRQCHIDKTRRENQRVYGPRASAWRACVGELLIT